MYKYNFFKSLNKTASKQKEMFEQQTIKSEMPTKNISIAIQIQRVITHQEHAFSNF